MNIVPCCIMQVNWIVESRRGYFTWEFLRAGGGGPGLVRLSAEPCLVAPFVGGGGGRDWEGTLGSGSIYHTVIGSFLEFFPPPFFVYFLC